MELLWILYMYFAPIAYMFKLLIELLITVGVITVVLIFIALAKVESEEHILKVFFYKCLAKIFPRHWKVSWCVEMTYSVDHCCDVTYVYNFKTGVKKKLRVKPWEHGKYAGKEMGRERRWNDKT